MIEGFIRSALASLGLTPEEAKERIDAALNDMREARERLTRIEEKLDTLLEERAKDAAGRKSA